MPKAIAFGKNGIDVVHFHVFEYCIVDMAFLPTWFPLRAQHFHHRGMNLGGFWRFKIAVNFNGIPAVLRVVHQERVERPQPVMWYRGKQVVGEMVILPHGKHSKSKQWIDFKNTRIADPAKTAITVLNNLTQDHEQAKGCEEGNHPKRQVVKWDPRV